MLKCLTNSPTHLYNGVDSIPNIMAFGKIGFAVAGAAALTTLSFQDSAEAQDNTVLAAAESPQLQAVIAEYRQCIDGAVAATDPKLVPGVDDATRKLVFDTMVEGCESIKQSGVRILAAQQRIETADREIDAITRSIIEGAKAEVGIKS